MLSFTSKTRKGEHYLISSSTSLNFSGSETSELFNHMIKRFRYHNERMHEDMIYHDITECDISDCCCCC